MKQHLPLTYFVSWPLAVEVFSVNGALVRGEKVRRQDKAYEVWTGPLELEESIATQPQLSPNNNHCSDQSYQPTSTNSLSAYMGVNTGVQTSGLREPLLEVTLTPSSSIQTEGTLPQE